MRHQCFCSRCPLPIGPVTHANYLLHYESETVRGAQALGSFPPRCPLPSVRPTGSVGHKSGSDNCPERIREAADRCFSL